MRTIRRETLPLNAKKRCLLETCAQSYAREKQFWLDFLRCWDQQARLGRPREIRDEMVKQGYKSRYGLQARHWKLALQDAAETWDKYWQALFVSVRSKISQNKQMADTGKHYAYFLLKGYPQFASLMKGGVPEAPFDISETERKQIAGYVRRLVKKIRGKNPTVKKARIIKFDENCYEVFEEAGRQYIKLMTLEKGKRLVVPLLGKTKIEGNLIVVLSESGLEIHVSQDLEPPSLNKDSTVEAVDFGYTEVMTDTQGMRYGKAFGSLLTSASDHLDKKMKKRGKLHALEKKARILKPKKAKRMRRYNLGKDKLQAKKRTSRAALECEINRGINQLLTMKNPSVLITEDLRHLFTYHHSKKMNRRFSFWLKGKIQERISFKALAEGFRHEQVNPAYGSQTCPLCGFVDSKNRKGDRFKCLHCRHEDIVDRVAALNYAGRFGDPEIGLYTPYNQVKLILQSRFHRRLEAGNPATVPDWTLDTASEVHPPPLSRHVCNC